MGEKEVKKYFDYHVEMGNNAIIIQSYNFGGYAHYPSKLGPLGEGESKYIVPRLYKLAKDANMPFWGYFTVSSVGIERYKYVEGVLEGWSYLEPSGPHIDVLCERIKEYLTMYPDTDWILFDMYSYGVCYNQNTSPLKVDHPWVQKGFKEVFGREIPKDVNDITPEETLLYKREILARQFYRIRDAVKSTNPKTKIMFNVPFLAANEPIWVNHPMVSESDGLFAESTREDVVEWLLKVRKPHQRVMTTLMCVGTMGTGPEQWRKWYERGCDFFAYAWGDAPDWRPAAKYKEQVEVVREAFHAMP